MPNIYKNVTLSATSNMLVTDRLSGDRSVSISHVPRISVFSIAIPLIIDKIGDINVIPHNYVVDSSSIAVPLELFVSIVGGPRGGMLYIPLTCTIQSSVKSHPVFSAIMPPNPL